MELFGYIMLGISLVMLGILISGFIFAVIDDHLQQENEQLKQLLTSILEKENISFEAYQEILQESAHQPQQTKPAVRRRLVKLDESQTEDVNHLL